MTDFCSITLVSPQGGRSPSAYRRYKQLELQPELRCDRAKRDEVLCQKISQVWHFNFQVYGADKVWNQLKREGNVVARCTVERLMRQLGLQGARRGKAMKTTHPDTSRPCPLDHVNRRF